MLAQRTLKTLTKATGVGLHSGERVELTLRPAQPDTGIVFRRVDLPTPVDIPANALAVTDTRLASTIEHNGAKVHTVEHLMSALAGLGLDNVYIDITAEEVPILDGSAASYVYLLQSAGVVTQKCAQALHTCNQTCGGERRGRQASQMGPLRPLPRLQVEI